MVSCMFKSHKVLRTDLLEFVSLFYRRPFAFSSFLRVKGLSFFKFSGDNSYKLCLLLITYLIIKISPRFRSYGAALRQIYVSYICSFSYTPFFNILCNIISVFLGAFCFTNSFFFAVLLVNGKQLSAAFISRYFAKKLRRGFGVRNLIFPIAKELKKLTINSNFLGVSMARKKHTFVDYAPFTLKYCVLFSHKVIIKLIRDNYSCFHSYLSMFAFPFLSVAKFGLDILVYYIVYKILTYYRNFIRFDAFTAFGNLRSITPISVILKNLYSMCNIYSFMRPFSISIFSGKMNDYIYLFYIVLTRIYGYLYRCWGRELIADYNSSAISKARANSSLRKLLERSRNLVGFKFQFLGRFTRRQRSTKMTFQYGYVPTNSISVKLDFANFVIPLVNSAVNVKV
eukprot:TRINITY_DN3069_c0_g1_i1.p1 TRINITY_DN3069_c0_g1~~TRINITY_DN3069_c0_g1_i1.p1  ORF type:complete len:398 (+),score=-30.11 TRINITY_DN3069_c0_g1_i1:144-1337(+)